MADYDWVAHGILDDFNFSFNSFFQSYTTPTLPLLRAGQLLISGDSLLGWQVLQTFILLTALLWLCFELARSGVPREVVVVLVVVVALSKPSVFWSYKIAREGLGEGLLYLTAASGIAALRTRRLPICFFAGVIFTVGLLNRPNNFLYLPIYLLLVFVVIWRDERRAFVATFKRTSKLAAFFLLGVMIVWAPWIIRSVRLYGAPVLISTQGPYVFFWELGEVELTQDDKMLKFTANSLQNEAPSKFVNDYDAYRYASSLIPLWLQQHPMQYVKLLPARFFNSIERREIDLSRISRFELFPNEVNSLLVDKTPARVYLGILGLLLTPLVFSQYLWPLFFIIVAPWANALLLLGENRMLEPMIPLLLFGDVLLFCCVIQLVRTICKSTRHDLMQLTTRPSAG